MTNRRNFIKQMASASIASSMSSVLFSQQRPSQEKMWGVLLHLSFNMWEEYIAPEREERGYRPYLRVSESLWNDARDKMAKEKMNMVLLDLGDGVKYESHPEIAVENAWSVKRLRGELTKFRELGIEPIPKLNFSAGHDAWLGKYSRMVSTEPYYNTCKNLIAEVIELFDKPRFFHLGMDEETAGHQKLYQHVLVRQKGLWWNDFNFLIGEVEKKGVRPWIWSDYGWVHPDQFFEKMPKSVLQSNWYYRDIFDLEKQKDERGHTILKMYTDLEAHAYDQIPCGTNFYKGNQQNIIDNVKYCVQHIADSRLKGFLQTVWVPTIEEKRESILKGIELTGDAKKWYEKNHKQ